MGCRRPAAGTCGEGSTRPRVYLDCTENLASGGPWAATPTPLFPSHVGPTGAFGAAGAPYRPPPSCLPGAALEANLEQDPTLNQRALISDPSLPYSILTGGVIVARSLNIPPRLGLVVARYLVLLAIVVWLVIE